VREVKQKIFDNLKHVHQLMRYILKKLADARALLLGSIEYVYFV
jgi:hypothetical protein